MSAPARPEYDLPDAPHRRPAEPGEPQARARRDRAVRRSFAKIEKDPRRAEAFRTIAGNERRHADIWAGKPGTSGDRAGARPAPMRVRTIVLMARAFGTMRFATWSRRSRATKRTSTPRSPHRRWRRSRRTSGSTLRSGSDSAQEVARRRRPRSQQARSRRESGGTGPASRERSGRSSSVSPTGFVSNLALVMGIAGASQGQGSFVLLAGIAGLLAGAFSMAAGEYISMQSQREPSSARSRSKRPSSRRCRGGAGRARPGLPGQGLHPGRGGGHRGPDVRRPGARARHAGPRGKLGLIPTVLGSPWAQPAGRSSPSARAIVPVIPYLLTSGSTAFLAAIALSIGSLFAVGAGVSLLTGRSLLFSGARQVLIGSAAAVVTYLVGHAIGGRRLASHLPRRGSRPVAAARDSRDGA